MTVSYAVLLPGQTKNGVFPRPPLRHYSICGTKKKDQNYVLNHTHITALH